jgi:tetratricopeptide (TPR) repeat protein/DNA-directed RNA polymerase subunit RPC12/RpoP
MLDLRCGECGFRFALHEDEGLKVAGCPRCGRAIMIPRAAPSKSAPSPKDDDRGLDTTSLDAPTRRAGSRPRARAMPPAPPPVPIPLPQSPWGESQDIFDGAPSEGLLTPVSRSWPERLWRGLRRQFKKAPLAWIVGTGVVVIVVILASSLLTRRPKREAAPPQVASEALPQPPPQASAQPQPPPQAAALPEIPQNIADATRMPTPRPAARLPLDTPPPPLLKGPEKPSPPATATALSAGGGSERRTSADDTEFAIGGGGGEQISGASRQYDNLQCMRIQAQHGIRIPPAAAILEVDGLRLRIANPSRLALSPAPILYLPRGSHAVCFRSNEQPVAKTIEGDFSAAYEMMRGFFGIPEAIRSREIFQRAAWAMDVHGAPFLLNFSGSQYAAEKKWKAAQRKFRRALAVNPMFSPAHLNLAECLLQEGARDEAAREVEWADVFNVGNVFGLADAIAQARRRLGLPPESREAIDAADLVYVSRENQSEEDLRMVALLEAMSRYAVRDEERAKVLNNLAVHFAESDRPELALHYFRNALEVTQHAGEGRHQLARRIFSHIRAVCRKAGFDEESEYRQMEMMVNR